MTRHHTEAASPAAASPAAEHITVSTEAERRAHVGKWIARHHRTATATLGTAMLFLPVVAGAQTQGEGLVTAAAIDGVREVQLRADGSAQLTLDNGSVLNISAQDVVINAAGDVQVSAQVAEIVSDAAAGAAAGGGGGAGGVIAGAAAAGVAGLAGAGGGGDGGSSAPAPVVFNAADVAGFSTFSDVFGREPEGDPDRITITMEEGGDPIILTESENRDPETGVWSLPENFAETFEDTEGEVTLRFTAEREVPPEEEDGDGDPVVEGEEIRAFKSSGNEDPDYEEVDSGTVTLLVDTVAPTIGIDTPIAGDAVLNIEEQTAGVAVTGTTDAEDGQTVRVTLGSEIYITTAQGGTWSVAIPPEDLSVLPDAETFIVAATVRDAAGNPADHLATASFATDFTAPVIVIDPVSDDDRIGLGDLQGDLVVTGTTTAEAGQQVTLSFDGQVFTGSVVAGGPGGQTWSVTVPQQALEAVRDGADADNLAEVILTATVADAAGNQAVQPATVTVAADFNGPSITIDDITGDNILNADEVTGDVTISGTTSNVGAARDVTVTVGTLVLPEAQTDASGGWSVILTQVQASGLGDAASVTVTAEVADSDGVPATTTATLTTDFTAPDISIQPEIAGDGMLNIAERDAGFDISGTTDAGDGQEVTVTLSGAAGTPVTATGPVQGGAWTVSFTPAQAADLDGWDTVDVAATVEDAAGNEGQATASFTTDFDPPEVMIDTLPLGGDTILNAMESLEDLVITGTATDTDQVTMTFNGTALAPVDVTDGAWSLTIPATTLQALDPDATIVARAEAMDAAGNIGAAVTSFETDFTPPALTVDPLEIGGFLNIADADGDVSVTGTVSGHDAQAVIVSVGGQDATASVDAQGNWTANFAAGALGGLADGATAFTVATQDAAGNPGSATSASFTVDLTAPDIAVDDPPPQPFVLDVAGRAASDGFGFTTSEGGDAVVTLTFTRSDGSGIVDLSLTGQLGDIPRDGPQDGAVFDFPLTPSDLAALTDLTDYTVEIAITDVAGNTNADGFALATDFEPEISLDAIGTEGVLILEAIDPNGVSISGTTHGVEAGEAVTVTLRDGAGFSILTDSSAMVQAGGTWTLDLPSATVEALEAGQAYAVQADVSNAAGREAAQAQQQLVAYEAAQTYLVADADAGSQVTMQILFDPRTELQDDGGFSLGETVTFDTTQITYQNPPAPTYANGLFGLTNETNAASGEVIFGGISTSFDVNEEVIVQFAMEQQTTEAVIRLDVVSTEGGTYSTLLGTAAADSISANNVDTVIRGRGGDDAIDLSGAGVNTVQFEAAPADNGFDTVTGFSIGGPLPDRMGFAGLDNETLRGDGSTFELLSGPGSVGVDTGLIVFTTAMADLGIGSVQGAIDGLTGPTDGDVLYFLGSDGTDAQLYEVQLQDGADQVTSMARFEGLGDLSAMTEANILGFDASAMPV